VVRARATLLVALLLGVPARGAAQPAAFADAEARRLEAGEVLTRFWKEKDGAGAGWAAGVVDASPEQVFRVIADVERYREFMKRMVASRIVLRRSTSRYRFHYKIDMPWPLADYECVTENVHEEDARRRIFARRWTLVSGTFHRNEGSWTVRAWRGGRTLLLYRVVLLPTTRAPGALVRYGTKVALPRSVVQFRERVARLQREGRL
jgi:ribosome-associated toxin RatA of RatAB toxin-antitoxin module